MIHNGCPTAVEASFTTYLQFVICQFTVTIISKVPRDISFLAKNKEVVGKGFTII